MKIVVNGLRLHVERAGTGQPLLLLHGFMGSTATWAPFLPLLSRRWGTIAVDLIGHGRSDAPEDPHRYSMEHCIGDLLAVLDRLEVECTAVLGYSMGGRVALSLAAAAPQRMSALALESASPGLATAGERQARIASDEALAQQIEGEGVPAFVQRWERLPLFSSQEALPATTRVLLRAQRLAHNPVGLANSLRGMGAGRQTPLWDRLADLDMPALLIAGAGDAKYRDLGGRMAAAMPNARLAVVPRAGHAVHLEQPVAFGEIIMAYFATQSEAKIEESVRR